MQAEHQRQQARRPPKRGRPKDTPVTAFLNFDGTNRWLRLSDSQQPGQRQKVRLSSYIARMKPQDFISVESLTLTILEPIPGRLLPIPPLLGRDILSRLALYEERTSRVLLLEPAEAEALDLGV